MDLKKKTGYLILSIATRRIKPILVIFSIFILLRGHNHPGGGFIAGLLAGAGVVIDAIANQPFETRSRATPQPKYLISTGLLLLLITALVGPFLGKAYLSGLWVSIPLPLNNELSLGTPLLFDSGVYLVVTGMLILVVLSILEELQWS